MIRRDHAVEAVSVDAGRHRGPAFEDKIEDAFFPAAFGTLRVEPGGDAISFRLIGKALEFVTVCEEARHRRQYSRGRCPNSVQTRCRIVHLSAEQCRKEIGAGDNRRR
jgi:hypothetical protein